MKEIKFKIIGQCPYTNRYFVQIIYHRYGFYAKITDFYKSIGAAKDITPETWDGDGDVSHIDLERFTAAEKIKEEGPDTSKNSMQVMLFDPKFVPKGYWEGEFIAANMLSVSLSQEDNEKIVFRSIWQPLKGYTGPLACQQRINLKKYYNLLRNKTLKLEDVEWSDLAKADQGCEDYQLLFLHQDGLYRIEFDSFDGEQGRRSLFYT